MLGYGKAVGLALALMLGGPETAPGKVETFARLDPAFEDEVQTEAGALHIEQGPAYSEHVVRVGDRILGRWVAFYVHPSLVFPDRHNARLVLLSENSGGSGCPLMYRMMEVVKRDQVQVTEPFGNCDEIDTVVKTAQGWALGTKERLMWVYAGGVIKKL